jgi:N-acyl-D-aspartate/D-glutamate deacylase
MLDLKITNATIVDGSGAPGFRGDVGISSGRIAAVGAVAEDARETLDARERTVAPGFIDVHTHYDAQVFWDPTLSPSCFHGVTTVIGGFCGFSIAPLTPDSADYLLPMLARVEGMPLSTLKLAVPWNWRSFGEYLGSFDGKIGLNAGFFAGHSAIRRLVMGKRAVGEKATSEELEKMKTLLGKSLAEGALGFSSSIGRFHLDGDRQPVPSRWADKIELVELAGILRDYSGTSLEIVPGGGDITEYAMELFTDMSVAAHRPLNWNSLMVTGRADAEERAAHQLSVSDYARSRGGEVVVLTLPAQAYGYMNFKSGGILDTLPGIWREIFVWPIEQRVHNFRDPEVRRRMIADAASVAAAAGSLARFGDYSVVAVASAQSKKHAGEKVGDIARDRGCDPIDLMLDMALEEGDLSAIFRHDSGGGDRGSYELRGRIWKDDRVLIGASDAGAHLDMVDSFAFSTALLEEGVRNHRVATLEQAVHLMTERPARYMGLIDRGLLKSGYHADIVVFDPETVGRGPTYRRYDVPGDEFRIYQDAIGVDHVLVNGIQIVSCGQHTGRLPGAVLRSGRDTRTVALDAMRRI